MATLRQIIVDTDNAYSGVDYVTLATAESTEQGDISTGSGSDEYVVFECYATSGSADSTADGMTIAGWTTDATGYIEVNGLLDASYGHRGIWDSGEYRITSTGTQNTITCEQAFTRFIGLQFTAVNVAVNILLRVRSCTDVSVEKCIFKHDTAGGATNGIYMAGNTGANHHYVSNNIIYDIGDSTGENAIHGEHSGTGKVYVYNNTIYGCYEGIDTGSGDTVAINNIVNNCTVSYNGSFHTGSGYNITDATPILDDTWSTTLKTGTTTSATTNKLNDSGGGLSVAVIGSIVEDSASNYSRVTAIDSDTVLSVADDIFGSSEAYTIYTNIYGVVDFSNVASDDFTLSYLDVVAMMHGSNEYADASLPVTDDILGNSRGSSSTDNFDIGAHHSLEYGRVVDPDSGAGFDYTSLSTWESTEQADLTTAAIGKICTATCRSTSGGADDTSLTTTIVGWTTEAANYIKMWADPTEAYRHAGVWDATKYRRTTVNDQVLNLQEDYVRIDGLQFDNAQTQSGQALLTIDSVSSSSNKIEIYNTIFNCNTNTSWWQWAMGVETAAVELNLYVKNCLFFNGHTTSSSGQTAMYLRTNNNCYLHNITIHGGDNGIKLASGTGTVYCKNVLVSNLASGGSSFEEVTGTLDINYCAAEDTDVTAQGGTGNRASQTFTFVDSANDNYELDPKDDGALLYGTNLYSNADLPIIDDIKGVSRGAATTDNYDIGAFYSDSVAHIVDPDSGAGFDYTSLSTWESTEQADLTTAGLNKISIATCRSTGGTADTTAFTISGWVTTATNYIKIWTDPDEAYRHAGSYPTGNKYRYEYTGSTEPILVQAEHVRFEGISFATFFDTATQTLMHLTGTVDFRISKCILDGTGGTQICYGLFSRGMAAGEKVYFYNNITYGSYYGIRTSAGDADAVIAYNNTMHDCTRGFRGGAEMILKNNISVQCDDNYFEAAFSTSSTHNITDLNALDGAFGATHATGTATSYGANKLNDSGGGLSGAQVNSIVENTTDATYSHVTVVDSDNQLTLAADIFDTGNEVYKVYTNMYGTVTFEGATYLLSSSDTVAKDKGTDLSEDGLLVISDDILGTSRPQ